jgi:GT2 family glycosyltransferase
LTAADPSPDRAFLTPPAVVQVQSVLYNNELDAIERSVTSLARSVELAHDAGLLARAHLAYGDCSPLRCISDQVLGRLQARHAGELTLTYEFFGGNIGSAAGHNRLATAVDADFLLVQNPDVVASPRLLQNMLEVFTQPGVGQTEAKQLPIEHPKDYHAPSGETSWASTACAMIPVPLLRQLGGFDADCFFLYCDDVDFSWRVRLAGYKVIFQPTALVFHDKRLSPEGRWQPSAAERYYSAEAALLLAHKWSRPALVAKILADFDKSGDDDMLRAAAMFRERREQNRLPQPIDRDHKVGQFIGIFYAKHRFPL